MTASQFFVLFGLPILIGVSGVVAGLVFRRVHARKAPRAHPAE
jgi:hypothetical protein